MNNFLKQFSIQFYFDYFFLKNKYAPIATAPIIKHVLEPPEFKPPPPNKLGIFDKESTIYILNPLEIGSIIGFLIGAVIVLFIKLVAAFVTS